MADEHVDQNVEQRSGEDIVLGGAAFTFKMSAVVPRLARNVQVLAPEVAQQLNDSGTDAKLLARVSKKSLAID
jgi:hypothetical protein